MQSERVDVTQRSEQPRAVDSRFSRGRTLRFRTAVVDDQPGASEFTLGSYDRILAHAETSRPNANTGARGTPSDCAERSRRRA